MMEGGDGASDTALREPPAAATGASEEGKGEASMDRRSEVGGVEGRGVVEEGAEGGGGGGGEPSAASSGRFPSCTESLGSMGAASGSSSSSSFSSK